MSMYSSLNCCKEPRIDFALNVITQKDMRICCLNCEREIYVSITDFQYSELFEKLLQKVEE